MLVIGAVCAIMMNVCNVIKNNILKRISFVSKIINFRALKVFWVSNVINVKLFLIHSRFLGAIFAIIMNA